MFVIIEQNMGYSLFLWDLEKSVYLIDYRKFKIFQINRSFLRILNIVKLQSLYG